MKQSPFQTVPNSRDSPELWAVQKILWICEDKESPLSCSTTAYRWKPSEGWWMPARQPNSPKLVLAYRFSEVQQAPIDAEDGVFLWLWKPFRKDEVRAAFGFAIMQCQAEWDRYLRW